MRIPTHFAVAALAAALCAQATTYYIDYSGGNDLANGTDKTTPWKHAPFMRAFTGTYNHLNGGDTFIFKGGETWPSAVFQMRITSQSNIFSYATNWYSGGSFSRPTFDFQNTIVTNYQGFTGFQKSAGIYFDGYDSGREIKGCILDGLDIKRHRTPAGAAAQKAATIVLRGWCHDNYITNCLIHDWSIAEPVTAGADDGSSGAVQGVFDPLVYVLSNTIAYCDINQMGITQRSGKAINGYFLTYSNRVHHYCTGIIGGGMILSNLVDHGEAGSDPLAHENTIYNQSVSHIAYNLITNNVAQGIYESSGQSYSATGPICNPGDDTATTLIHDNVIFETGFGKPIDIDLEGHSERVGVKVWNNTAYYASGAVINLTSARAGMHLNYLSILNNHVINNAGSGTIFYDPQFVSNIVVSANNVSQSIAVANGQGYHETNRFAPVSTLVATYHAGQDLSAWPYMGLDYLGQLRGTSFDAGAYEFTPGPPPDPPAIRILRATTTRAGSIIVP